MAYCWINRLCNWLYMLEIHGYSLLCTSFLPDIFFLKESKNSLVSFIFQVSQLNIQLRWIHSSHIHNMLYNINTMPTEQHVISHTICEWHVQKFYNIKFPSFIGYSTFAMYIYSRTRCNWLWVWVLDIITLTWTMINKYKHTIKAFDNFAFL